MTQWVKALPSNSGKYFEDTMRPVFSMTLHVMSSLRWVFADPSERPIRKSQNEAAGRIDNEIQPHCAKKYRFARHTNAIPALGDFPLNGQ